MIRLFIVTLLFFAATASGTSEKKIRLESLIQKALPSQLRDVHPGKTTAAEIEKLLGKPLKGGKELERFYRLADDKIDNNDVTIGLTKQSTVRYFYYKLPTSGSEEKYLFSTFKPFIPAKALKRAEADRKKSSNRADAGRTFDVAMPEKGLLLKFHLEENPSLDAIVSWKPGARMP